MKERWLKVNCDKTMEFVEFPRSFMEDPNGWIACVQRELDCYIFEHVSLDNGHCLLIDESGKLHPDWKINPLATALCGYDVIAGDCLVGVTDRDLVLPCDNYAWVSALALSLGYKEKLSKRP